MTLLAFATALGSFTLGPAIVQLLPLFIVGAAAGAAVGMVFAAERLERGPRAARRAQREERARILHRNLASARARRARRRDQ